MLYTTAYVFEAPISTTHTITSAVMGVGATKRLSAVRWGVARSILIAWVLTFPAWPPSSPPSATGSAHVFLALSGLFGPGYLRTRRTFRPAICRSPIVLRHLGLGGGQAARWR